MSTRSFFFLLICVSLVTLSFPSTSRAETFNAPEYAGSVYDLINGVDALRAGNGLAPYSINPILMYTAQAQADFMAANGIVTHSGPGGIGVTNRLLAAGYPLAGDLSLGGFRSENITSGGESMSAQAAVDQWTGDAPHLNTMLSPDLTEIGAGIAVSDGRVYYVIDCARPTTASGASQVVTTPLGGGSAVPANEAPISVVIASTPNAAGNVIHEVQYGQSLWQIAITYDVRIDDIKRLNNFSGDDIYPGEKLLIKTGVLALPTASATETAAPELTATFTVTVTPTETTIPPTFTSVPTATPSPISGDNSTTMGIVIGILALALLGGGVITWMGGSKKNERD